MEGLRQQIRGLVDRVVENNLWRQRRCFNLIPSENTPSLLVKLCEISDPSGRYAEHRTMKGREVYFYQGIDFIRDVEIEAQAALKEYFGCQDVELRPISGQMANEVVFKAATRFVNRGSEPGTFRRLRCVMNNDLGKGGHLSSQPMGALFNYVDIDPETGKENCVNFPVRADNPYRIDIPAMLETTQRVRPELVVFGKSMFLHSEPVKEFAALAAELDPQPVIMYDMAHVLGLYGVFQEPFQDGAHVVTGSTHKSFFGPQRGVVAVNLQKGHPLRKLWLDVKSRAFPGSTSNHHLGTLLALLMSTYEMNQFKGSYQGQVRRNAQAFARALVEAGLPVEGDPELGYTETHQVLIRVSQWGPGEEIARRLEENNIVTNYQALPDDESFLVSSGIRTGVPEMTRFGMTEKDFGPLAEFMAAVIKDNRTVGDEVAEYRRRFPRMQFCLPPEEALELGARVLSSAFPGSDQAKAFADALVDEAART